MRKPFLLSLAMLALPCTTMLAGDYNYMTFTKADGTAASIGVSNLEMTISDGKLVATNGSETLTLTPADLAKMAFTENATAITSATTDSNDGTVKVFNAAGMYVGEYANADEARQHLTAGVYIIKSKSLTSKLSVR